MPSTRLMRKTSSLSHGARSGAPCPTRLLSFGGWTLSRQLRSYGLARKRSTESMPLIVIGIRCPVDAAIHLARTEAFLEERVWCEVSEHEANAGLEQGIPDLTVTKTFHAKLLSETKLLEAWAYRPLPPTVRGVPTGLPVMNKINSVYVAETRTKSYSTDTGRVRRIPPAMPHVLWTPSTPSAWRSKRTHCTVFAG